MTTEEKLDEMLLKVKRRNARWEQEFETTFDLKIGSKRDSDLYEIIAKNNLQIAENSRAILKLADKIEVVVDHEKRLGKLERKVFS